MRAFLFPGQGAQQPQAGLPWRSRSEWRVISEIAAASDADIEPMLLHDSHGALRGTFRAQLATFATSAIIGKGLEKVGVRPAFLAGHSVGEYSALVAAGVLSLPAASRIVAARGRAMAAACDQNPGGMRAVIGLDEDLVTAACARADDEVWIANYNEPQNHAVSGSHSALSSMSEIAMELGARRCVSLQVGGPFHTRLMLPARDALRDALSGEEFQDAATPVAANVDAQVHQCGSEWPSLLSAQLCNPVRWYQTIGTLWHEGVRTFIEVGPGRGLTKMVKRLYPTANAVAVNSPEDLSLVGTSSMNAAPEAVWESSTGVLRSPVPGEVRLEGGTPTTEGVLVSAGEIVAYVDGVAVQAPRSGWLLDWTAPGARVSEGEFLLRISR